MTGKLRLRPGVRQVIRRSDLDIAPPARQGAAARGLHRGVRRLHGMKLDQEPFKDVRVRRALSPAQRLARGARDQRVVAGQGPAQPAHPGRAQGMVDPDRPAPAGGPPALRVRPGGGQAAARRGRASERLQDAVRDDAPATAPTTWTPSRSLKNWKAAGVDAELKLKEYGAFISSTIFGKFDKMIVRCAGLRPIPTPTSRAYMPGQPLNSWASTTRSSPR